ncbi:hypothetical protein H7H82_03020 [Mycobacterium heidelbergense]|uniref:hypothetical protein n=1 Tax=Mycobacterium heidelbergense TaxID=53376 RepID=UPI00114F09C0|nr:hypothetical protein [Mycobacterium heidelbergense]MCV7049585.1 hypothetical protein [Mycobacterium heidelbergense]BBZ52720.1 hypothetical protein MHEI_44370 [Mycobacterium heidelbergense]
MNISPLTLSGQLRTLSTVGAPSGQTDGSKAIDAASPDVRLALNKLARDSSELADHYAAIANGLPLSGPDRQLSPLVTSFTEALAACFHAGFRPSWFDPNELTGR